MRIPRTAYVIGILALGAVPSGRAAAHVSAAEWHFETEGRCSTCAGNPIFHWDMYYVPHHGGPTRKAAVYQGTASAFTDCMIMRISAVDVNAASYVMAADNRGFTTQEWSSGNTRVIRETYFPDSGGLDFARWVDNVRNAGAAAADISIQYYCYYRGCTGGGTYYFDGGFDGGGVEGGGAGDDCTVGSSDGDELTEATDLWFAWNDADASAYPAVAIVTHGDGADEEPTTITYNGWSAFTIDFRLDDIPAGENRNLLLFVVQAEDTDTAIATADFLTGLPPEATDGLDDPLPDFENFITDGRPAVSPGGPYNVPEGGSVILEPRIFDREGDAYIWAWDLDNDGTFEEDALNPIFSAETIDGPDERTVSIHVEEDFAGGHIVDRSTDIEILNVAPIILSEPPTDGRRGGMYTYTPVVADPAIPTGTEPMTFELIEDEHPDGMAIADPLTGRIEWTPRADQIADHDVEFYMEDDDGGSFTQTWTITVTDNTPPFQATPLYPVDPTDDGCVRVARPTFKVSNSSDLDEDPLVYFFEVDKDPGFRSIDLQQSEPVPQGISGFTEWQVIRALQDQQTYYWRTWVTDGIEESEKIVNVFQTCLVDGGGDADTDVDADTDIDADADADSGNGADAGAAGCACGTTGSAPEGFAFALLAIAGLISRRKK